MIYAIGDIHGENEALREMLAKLPVAPSDLVIFLGDAINRGPDSFDCVEQIVQFDRCNKVFIQGNHEEDMQFSEGNDRDLWEGENSFGSAVLDETTLDSYTRRGYILKSSTPSSIPLAHLRFYSQAETWTLPFYITDDYIFTHAGWDLTLPLTLQTPHNLRWGKVKSDAHPYWTQTVVRGHTPFAKVMFARTKQYIGVDTGCSMGGPLSAVALPTNEVYTARPASYLPDWYTRLRARYDSRYRI